jgi:formyl-CoA transferase
MVRSPLRMSGSPTTTPVAPPTLGQHTREVLGKVLDYSAERIDALEREGAIRCGG